MSKTNKPILCLDFDGVIHSYESGWKGIDTVADGPTDGAMAFIAAAQEWFTVAVYSSRSGSDQGRKPMKEWMRAQLLSHFEGDRAKAETVAMAIMWPETKPPAMVSLDDRGWQFTGVWPDMSLLRSFKPWNRK